MERRECEMKIKDLIIDIMDTYNEYYPDGEYISMHVRKYPDHTIMSCNNNYWDTDKEHPLDMTTFI